MTAQSHRRAAHLAHFEGHIAHETGQSLDSCPYRPLSDLAKAWIKGWHEEEADNARVNLILSYPDRADQHLVSSLLHALSNNRCACGKVKPAQVDRSGPIEVQRDTDSGMARACVLTTCRLCHHQQKLQVTKQEARL